MHIILMLLLKLMDAGTLCSFRSTPLRRNDIASSGKMLRGAPVGDDYWILIAPEVRGCTKPNSPSEFVDVMIGICS
jgi:hypothetical protein